jgi:AcrR family transcriptional regulator
LDNVATSPGRKRHTADERREDVIAAAIIEFATHGLYGSSTETIAERAGISQPYVLRLFGTKKALFLAAVQRVTDQVMERWRLALERLDPDAGPAQRLRALGAEYEGLVGEVNALRLVLQSFSSAEDVDVRESAHRCLKSMYTWLAANTGASPLALQQFFAYGMMLTVAASIQAADVAPQEIWARTFVVIPIEQE